VCIATNGEFNSQLSADELTFCCRPCGDGCQGGYPIEAWLYFQRHGLVTGGSYNTTNVILLTILTYTLIHNTISYIKWMNEK